VPFLLMFQAGFFLRLHFVVRQSLVQI